MRLLSFFPFVPQLYSRDGTDVDSFVVRTQYYLRDFVFSEATVVGGVLTFTGFLVASLQGLKTLVRKSSSVHGSIGGALLALPLFYLGVFHSLSNMPLDEELLYGVHERFWQQVRKPKPTTLHFCDGIC